MLAGHKIIRFPLKTFDDIIKFFDDIIKTRKICPLETGKNTAMGK